VKDIKSKEEELKSKKKHFENLIEDFKSKEKQFEGRWNELESKENKFKVEVKERVLKVHDDECLSQVQKLFQFPYHSHPQTVKLIWTIFFTLE
jgi:predicted nucleotide-binding protein (sugar kinase/HSP70/actin superfamily)